MLYHNHRSFVRERKEKTILKSKTMKNTKFPPKNPPQRNTTVMETQTRGEEVEKRPSSPPGRTWTRSAIKLDLSINIGESSARSRNPRVPVARKGERASVPRRGPAGSPRGPPMNSGRRRGIGLGLSLRSLRSRCAFRLL